MISVPIASLTLTIIMGADSNVYLSTLPANRALLSEHDSNGATQETFSEQSDLISVLELLDDIKERPNINSELGKYNLFLSIMHDFRHEECVNLPSSCL